MLRQVAAIIAGYVLWTLLWITGHMVLFTKAGEVAASGLGLSSPAMILPILLYSFFCSLAAGWCTALIDRERTRLSVLIMGGLLLLTGLGVQISDWTLMPAWYHLSFLVMLLPLSVLGGRLAGR